MEKQPMSVNKEKESDSLMDRFKKSLIYIVIASIAGLIIAYSTVSGALLTGIDNTEKLFNIIHSPTTTPTLAGDTCKDTIGINNNSTSIQIGHIFCTYRGHRGLINTLAWSPNGKRVASAGNDGTVQVWDAITDSDTIIYRGHKGSVNTLAWSPDGERIASGGDDGTIQVWVSDTGNIVYSYNANDRNNSNKVTAIDWSPDGQHIAFGTENGSVEIFLAQRGGNEDMPQRLIPLHNNEQVVALSWSSNSKQIAITYSGDGISSLQARVEIWNRELNRKLITYSADGLFAYAMAWSPDGKLIAIVSSPPMGTWGTVEIRAISQEKKLLDTEYNPGIQSLAWSCDSRLIALGSTFGGFVYLWDVKAKKQIFLYQAQVGEITALAWSPDGQRIASASSDGIVRVWQASEKRICVS